MKVILRTNSGDMLDKLKKLFTKKIHSPIFKNKKLQCNEGRKYVNKDYHEI